METTKQVRIPIKPRRIITVKSARIVQYLASHTVL